MEYSTDTSDLLILEGFELAYSRENKEAGEELHYDVYLKGYIEVTICHIEKIVTTSISSSIETAAEMKLSFQDIKDLDRILNKLNK